MQVKYRPVDSIKNHSYGSDPSEQDINNHFPGMNDDGDESSILISFKFFLRFFFIYVDNE